MNKRVILSTDSTKDYWDLLPLVCYSWNKIDIKPIVYVVGNIPDIVKWYCKADFEQVEPVWHVRDSTLAQLWRLFAWVDARNENDVLITSDADMVIAKNIFNEDVSGNKIVSYGHDLTGYGSYPMCYVMARAETWSNLIPDLNIPDDARSEDWARYWEADQFLLTKKIKEYGLDKVQIIKRGHDAANHGLPIGRWDRYKFENIPRDIIDVHMPRGDFDAQVKVFKHLYPNDDYSFLLNFKEELLKLIE